MGEVPLSPNPVELMTRDGLVQDPVLTQCRGTSLIRNTPQLDPTVAICLRAYGGPIGVGVSYERGTPVRWRLLARRSRQGFLSDHEILRGSEGGVRHIRTGSCCRFGLAVQSCQRLQRYPKESGSRRYRLTSLIRNCHPVGPYSRTIFRLVGCS